MNIKTYCWICVCTMVLSTCVSEHKVEHNTEWEAPSNPRPEALPIDALNQSSSELFSTSFDKGQLTATVDGYGKGQLENTGETFSLNSGTFTAAIPIASKFSISRDNGYHAWRVLAHAKITRINPYLDTINDRKLYNSVLGGSAIIAFKKNLFLMYAGVSAAGDSNSITTSEIRPVAAGLGSYRMSSKVSLLYGGAFTYLYGRRLVLPIAGLSYSYNKTWSSTWLFPFYGDARYNHSKKLSFVATLKASGGQYRLENDSLFEDNTENIYLQLRQARFGLRVEWKLSPTWQLAFETGAVVGRSLAFTTGDTELSRDTISSVGFAQLGITYSFGDSIKRVAKN